MKTNCTITTQGGRLAEGTAQGRKGMTHVLVAYKNKAGQPRLRWVPVARVQLHNGVRINELPRYLPHTICDGVTYDIVAGDDVEWIYDHQQCLIKTPSKNYICLPTQKVLLDWKWKAFWKSKNEIGTRIQCQCGRRHKLVYAWVTVGEIQLKLAIGTRSIQELKREQVNKP